MAKASANLFPYVHLVPAAAPSSPSAGSQRLYLDSGDSNKLKRKDSAGTVTTIEGGGSGSVGILAYTEATASATYTTTSATDADVDATNLSITFTLPASGKALVALEAVADYSGSAGVDWSLRQGSSTIKSCSMGAINYARRRATFIVTGTPGASVTYKWGFLRYTSGTHNIYTGGAGGTAGNALMTATALP